MKKVIFVYDDTIKVPSSIQTVIGQASYGKIILKRKQVYNRIKEIVNKTDVNLEFIKMNERREVFEKLKKFPKDLIIFHFFANYVIKDTDSFQILIEKVPFMKQNYQVVQDNKIVAIVFSDVKEYKSFLNDYDTIMSNQDDMVDYEEITTEAFLDISNYNDFLSYISGGFDARFFNSLEGNDYVITKKSTNKKKIKQEYLYYQLLPDDMKKWMVMPYNYEETDKYAKYTMERLHATDIAIRWTHKAIDEDEFVSILKKAFYYLTNRTTKNIKKEEYESIANKLYKEKVKARIDDLKKDKLYETFDMFIKSGTEFNSIDEVYDYYLKLYDKYSNKKKNYIAVIGHGDLCFANMLYNKEADLLKLIDPKGALTEEELWTNPYYDVAKLSHSICGNYDFFNCGSYSIYLDNNLKFSLDIYFDNTNYKKIFKTFVEDAGFDYKLVRLYEASLFLSMLPLHMDNPQKVFGFLLNAINILKEIENV